MKHSFAILALVVCVVMAASNALAAAPPPTVAEVRRALAPLQPDGVRIQTLTIEGNRSTVVGNSPSNASVSDFMRKIDSSANFERVELAEIQREDAGIRFNLSMEITCSDAAEATCLVPEQGVAAVKTQSGGVHKCKVGGAVRFQDRPCAPGTEAR